MGIFDVELRTKDGLFRPICSAVRSYFIVWTESYYTYYDGLREYAIQSIVNADWYQTNGKARERSDYARLNVDKN